MISVFKSTFGFYSADFESKEQMLPFHSWLIQNFHKSGRGQKILRVWEDKIERLNDQYFHCFWKKIYDNLYLLKEHVQGGKQIIYWLD